MTTPGNEPSGTSPDASSGYEYPSLDKSAPTAEAAAAANPVPASEPSAWETPGIPAAYPDYPAPAYPPAPHSYPAEPPAYQQVPPTYPQYGQGHQYGQGYPVYPPGQPSSYPPPGYPAGGGYPGYPPPGYANPYGYGGYGHTGGTNGLAMASLISSITGVFCCVGAVPGIIMGIIALNQIKASQQDGKGVAIAGIIIGAAIIVFWLLAVIVAVASGNNGSTYGSF